VIGVVDAIYARQSIDKKDSISIESQIAHCRSKALPGEKCTVYADRGYSGKNTLRPQFAQMMNDIRAGKIQKVIIYRLDRISRAIIDFANMFEVFEKHGVSIVSYSDPIDTTTPMGRAMINVAMVFAQLERETIQERVRDNYYSRGKDGFYLGGAAPYGFKKVETFHGGKKTYTYEADEVASERVRQLFQEYATTDVALGAICARLNKAAVLTNRQRAWTSVSLGRLLRNPAYVRADADVFLYLKNKGATMNSGVEDYIGRNGCYLYGERKGVTTSRFTDISKSFVTLGLHEGLVDSDTWISCQNKLDHNRQVKNTGKGRHTWLSGIIKCGYCKMAINVVNGYKDKKYIACGGRKLRICYDRKRTFLIEDIEAAVAGALIPEIRNMVSGVNSIGVSRESKEENELKIRLVKVDEEISAMLAKIPMANETVMRYINEAIENLDKEKRETLAKLNQILSGKARRALPMDSVVAAITDWDAIPFDKKKRIARAFIKAVYVTDEGMDIHYTNAGELTVSGSEP